MPLKNDFSNNFTTKDGKIIPNIINSLVKLYFNQF